MKRASTLWQDIDKVSLVLFLVLIILGWLNIYAAVYNEDHKGLLNLSQRYGKQFIWILATILVAVFVVIIDNRFYFFFGYFIYGGFILILALVLVLGKEINGARSWFEFGALSLQPSEFAKVGTALAIARYLNNRSGELTRIKVLIPALAIILIPASLTALQPDFGSVAIYLSFFFVLFREGMSPYIFVTGSLMIILFLVALLVNNLYVAIALIVIAYVIIWFAVRNPKVCLTGMGIFLVITGLVFAADHYFLNKLAPTSVVLVSLILSGLSYSWYIYRQKAGAVLIVFAFLVGSVIFVSTVGYTFNHLLKPHHKERVSILLGLKSDPHGAGYNVNQSVISIGSGGFSGKGYLRGTQTKFKFVPAQSTDFIFCTVGEEWGFLGSIVVIGLYVALLLRLIFLAERQRSSFSRIYGYGVVSVFLTHFFINIGMALGLVPVIGIPLPFFSYGGSSLWGFTILLFIFLRLDASRTEYLV
ncbi:MAG TPA: rod shape-determining protein RodA [Bacteroidales bacterium]|nr:rod shape-determining protein RodA [Bacteroidales bacterium]